MKTGKRYTAAAQGFDRTVKFTEVDALELVKKNATAKFDETIELHIRTGCDSRHADQQVRGSVVLPAGTGKKVRILVFAKGAKADEAQAAGADFVGAEELIPKIQDGWFDYDVIIATPDMMGKVEYRLDKANIFHVAIGKASFTTEQLKENLDAIMSAIVKARPATLKGTYLKSATLTSTMGPGVKMDTVQFGA